MDRKLIQDLFIRICSDSKFTIEFDTAAQLTGSILKIHPMTVAGAFPYIDVMKEIAKGNHPSIFNNKKHHNKETDDAT